jgi:hypothetical protein
MTSSVKEEDESKSGSAEDVMMIGRYREEESERGRENWLISKNWSIRG